MAAHHPQADRRSRPVGDLGAAADRLLRPGIRCLGSSDFAAIDLETMFWQSARVCSVILSVLALVLSTATPASACLELPSERSRRTAFEAAHDVVRVVALTESYQDVPLGGSLRAGVATARVIEVLKGRSRIGQTVVYRVVDGAEPVFDCPARRFTRPGSEYTLYLEHVADAGPPILVFPTD